MGAAFTLEEQQLIRTDLKKAGRKYLIKYGMKKTSIDQLIAEVGISKGAFYKFFESKEHLFFEVLEDIHDEIYKQVAKILKDEHTPSPLERIENAFLYAYKVFSDASLLDFMTNEVPYMIRKLPSHLISAHEESDAHHIDALLVDAGINLNTDPEFLASLVRAIVSLSRSREIIGEHHDDVIRFLIHHSCTQLISI